MDVYQMWSMGPHGCAGRAIAITALASMTRVCAQLKNLRRAPGLQGQIKSIPGPVGSKKYLTDDWSRFQPFAGSKSSSVANLPCFPPALIRHDSLESAFRRLPLLI